MNWAVAVAIGLGLPLFGWLLGQIHAERALRRDPAVAYWTAQHDAKQTHGNGPSDKENT